MVQLQLGPLRVLVSQMDCKPMIDTKQQACVVYCFLAWKESPKVEHMACLASLLPLVILWRSCEYERGEYGRIYATLVSVPARKSILLKIFFFGFRNIYSSKGFQNRSQKQNWTSQEYPMG